MRTSKELILATRPYARDNPALSWWCVLSTMVLLAAAATLCLFEWHWAVRTALSILTGLLMVRMFVIYHDYQHGTILKHSRLARWLMTVVGLGLLNAPSIWARSHNHHHRNNCRLHGGFIGSFITMTTDEYAQASRLQRLDYQIRRHPLTIALALFTVFLFGMTLRPLMHNPRMHLDCLMSLVVVFSVAGGLVWFGGWDALVYGLLLPGMIGSALGAYLFYAQHNYPGVLLRDRAGWDHAFAALNSSSYIPMNPLMAWFTANIGYHHIHHLNHKIPFYNLPKAMADLEELQTKGNTTLWPWDIRRCLKLKLWDPKADRFITFAEHRAAAAA